MKKIIFLALSLAIMTPTVIFSGKIHTISEIMFRTLYIQDIANYIYTTVDCFDRPSNACAGTLVATIGLSLTTCGIKSITKDFEELCEKFEDKEGRAIEWRKAPRKIITSFLAFLASVYGLTITYAGCMRLIHSDWDSKQLIEFCKKS